MEIVELLALVGEVYDLEDINCIIYRMDKENETNVDNFSGVNKHYLSQELKNCFVDCFLQTFWKDSDDDGSHGQDDSYYDDSHGQDVFELFFKALNDNHVKGKIRCTGSRVEGTITPTHLGLHVNLKSDIDKMYIIDKSEIVKDVYKYHIEYIPDSVYVKVLLLPEQCGSDLFKSSIIEQAEGKYILSPMKIKENIRGIAKSILTDVTHTLNVLHHLVVVDDSNISEGTSSNKLFSVHTEFTGPSIKLSHQGYTEDYKPCWTTAIEEDEDQSSSTSEFVHTVESDFVLAIPLDKCYDIVAKKTHLAGKHSIIEPKTSDHGKELSVSLRETDNHSQPITVQETGDNINDHSFNAQETYGSRENFLVTVSENGAHENNHSVKLQEEDDHGNNHSGGNNTHSLKAFEQEAFDRVENCPTTVQETGDHRENNPTAFAVPEHDNHGENYLITVPESAGHGEQYPVTLPHSENHREHYPVTVPKIDNHGEYYPITVAKSDIHGEHNPITVQKGDNHEEHYSVKVPKNGNQNSPITVPVADVPENLPITYFQQHTNLVTISNYESIETKIYTSLPIPAKQWVFRERKWPGPELIRKVLEQDYYLVPKSSATETRDIEWCLSFSFAEKELMISIPVYSWCKHCYRIFKCLIKYHLDRPKIISTYHCKTVFFWTLENQPPETWDDKNLGERFLNLLDVLLHAVIQRKLPHYFVPEFNLFQKINVDFILDIAQRLSEIRSKPLKFIYRRGIVPWDSDFQGMTIEEMLNWNQLHPDECP